MVAAVQAAVLAIDLAGQQLNRSEVAIDFERIE
nr:hypothetical protein CPGR_02778 [Mycolicibacterium komanii]